MNDDIHSLVGAYAVDAVDDAERARFEDHLATCAGCRAEVESLRGAAAHLAASTDTAPPASLKASLLRDIRSVRPLPPVLDEPDELPGDDGQLVAGQDPAPVADPTPAPTAEVADLTTRREQKAPRRHPVARWVATMPVRRSLSMVTSIQPCAPSGSWIRRQLSYFLTTRTGRSRRW